TPESTCYCLQLYFVTGLTCFYCFVQLNVGAHFGDTTIMPTASPRRGIFVVLLTNLGTKPKRGVLLYISFPLPCSELSSPSLYIHDPQHRGTRLSGLFGVSIKH